MCSGEFVTPSVGDRVLTLVVPGLLPGWLSGAARGQVTIPRLPALETLLARGDRLDRPPCGYHARLFALFGMSVESVALPIAPLTRMADCGVMDKGAWLRADPVFLQADGARLVLAADRLRIARDEAEAFEAELREVLAPEGLALETPNPQRWYLRLPQLPDVRMHAPAAALGRDIHDYLPGGPEGKRWRRMFNALQMVLHASQVNARREARGDVPVNSLWFWGAGVLPPAPARAPYVQAWTDEALAVGLARLAGLPVAAPVADLDAWLNAAISPGDHVVILEDAARPVDDGDAEAWLKVMAKLEMQWFMPLLAALRRGDLQALRLYFDDGAVAVSARCLRRLWRRRRPLALPP